MRAALICFILLFTAHSQASGFVGNGGVGVLREGKVFLLDLEEKNLSEDYDVPRETARWVEQLDLDVFEQEIGLPPRSLQAALSKIETHYPGMGRALAEVILFFEWQIVDHALKTTPDSLSKKENLVPVAHRSGLFVMIHRGSWELMPMTHRIALLIHEAAFPMGRWDCDLPAPFLAPTRCDQKFGEKVREGVRRVLLPEKWNDGVRLSSFFYSYPLKRVPSPRVIATISTSQHSTKLIEPKPLRRAQRRAFGKEVCEVLSQQPGSTVKLAARREPFYFRLALLGGRLQLDMFVNRSRHCDIELKAPRALDACRLLIEEKLYQCLSTFPRLG